MGEANARVVELDDACPKSCFERGTDTLPLCGRFRDQLNGRPGERRDLEENIDGLRRQPGETTAEELSQALRHP